MQHTLSLPINKPCGGAACFNDSSRLGKRKLSFPTSFDYKETITNKKRKKGLCLLEDEVTGMDRDFSIDLNLPDVSVSFSDNNNDNNNDIFDWIENVLGKGKDETFNAIPSTVLPTEIKDENHNTDLRPGRASENIDIDSFLNLNESDPCYEEMISLLALGDNDDNNEENVFKKIQESFVSDRLLEHHSFPLTTSRVSTSKISTLKRSPSFNTRRARSSRIGIRKGYDELVKANRLTAKTRHMLLNCKPSLYKNNSQ